MWVSFCTALFCRKVVVEEADGGVFGEWLRDCDAAYRLKCRRARNWAGLSSGRRVCTIWK